MKPKTNIAPSRKPRHNSTLIESNHIPLFASWIDKKYFLNYNEKNIPYDFKLIYHSSKDGFNAESFHRNCDNKGATIWVGKIQGSTQLIGGYNPLDWNGNNVWKNTADSFVFNFSDGKKISTAKLGYVKNASKAVRCVSSRGPQMGYIFSDDFINWYNNDYGSETCYPNIGIPAHAKFILEDCEVFQVVKK